MDIKKPILRPDDSKEFQAFVNKGSASLATIPQREWHGILLRMAEIWHLDWQLNHIIILTKNGRASIYITKAGSLFLAKMYGIEVFDVCVLTNDKDYVSIKVYVREMATGRVMVNVGGCSKNVPSFFEIAMTKAMRRGILAIVGVGFNDESEFDNLEVNEV